MNNLVLGPPGDHLITENRDSSGPIWVPSASHQATKTHEKLPVFTTKRNSSAPGLQRRASHHLTKWYPTWGRRPNQGGGPVVWHSSPYVVIYVLVIYCAMWGRWVYSHALSHRHVVIRPPPQPNTTNTRTNWGEGIQTHGPGNRSSVIQERCLFKMFAHITGAFQFDLDA